MSANDNDNINDFDQPPLYDYLTKNDNDLMSDIWIGWFSTFYQTLVSYLTQGGILLPQLTTVQRDGLLNPQNGQMIYNITLDTAQYYQVSSGAWISFP